MDEKILKDKQAFHVVLTTHNSRTSKRMKKYNVQKGQHLFLSLDEEIVLTRIIGDIIKKNNFHCLAYNICKDHVHLLLVCAYEDLSKIIQKIKAISSRLFHQSYFPLEHGPLDESRSSHRKGKKYYTPLWSQKFFRADLDVWQLAKLSNKPGLIYEEDYLDRTISYIIGNRDKHRLPKSEELEEVIKSFLEDQDNAFAEGFK